MSDTKNRKFFIREMHKHISEFENYMDRAVFAFTNQEMYPEYEKDKAIVCKYFGTLMQIEYNILATKGELNPLVTKLVPEFATFVFGDTTFQDMKYDASVRGYDNKQPKFYRERNTAVQPTDAEIGENPVLERI